MNIETLPNGNRKLVLRQSDFKTYMTCGREFYLGVVRGLEPAQRKASVADVGTFVHEGLRAHYTAQPVEAAMAAATNAAIEADPLLVSELTDASKLAHIMVTGYLEWLEVEAPDHGLTAINVEQRFETHVGTYYGVEVYVSSAIDLLFRDDQGGVWVYDHKTVDRFDDISGVLDIDFQGQTYDLAIRRNLDLDPLGFVHNQIRRVKRTGTAKPPFYRRQTVRFNAAQRERHLLHLEGLANEIALKVNEVEGLDSSQPLVHRLFRPLPTRDCSWRCDFMKSGRVCPMLDHEPEGAEEMLSSPLFKEKEKVG